MSAKDRFVRIVSTFFGVGYLPWAPGTFGSVPGLFFVWWINDPLAACGLTAAFSILGFVVSKPAQTVLQAHDPRPFVFDEVCGMMLSLLWLPKDLKIYAAAFVLFRAFDTLKPWPISIFHKMKSAPGIMADDLAAGIITNLLLQTLLRIFF